MCIKLCKTTTSVSEFFRPLKTTAPLEAVCTLLRKRVAPWEQDRQMSVDLEAAAELVRSGKVLDAVSPFINEVVQTEK